MYALVGERGECKNMALAVLVVDDHPMVRSGICGLISRTFEGCVILEAACLADSLRVLSEHGLPDLILCDLALPDSSGLATIEAIASAAPGASVLVLTGSEEGALADNVMKAGAKAFLLKTASPSELAIALRKVARRLPKRANWHPERSSQASMMDQADTDVAAKLASLPPRAAQVAELCAIGLTNKGIARELGISENTVRAHVSALLQRFSVRSRTDLAKLGFSKTGSLLAGDILKV